MTLTYSEIMTMASHAKKNNQLFQIVKDLKMYNLNIVKRFVLQQ